MHRTRVDSFLMSSILSFYQPHLPGDQEKITQHKEAKMPKELLKDKEYDLVSVIYNASQAADTCRQYVQDAKGDQEAERFFNNVIETNADLVQKGKDLLKNRI